MIWSRMRDDRPRRAGAVLDFARDREKELAQQEDAEDVDQRRQVDRLVRIEQVKVANQDEGRDDRHLLRHHQRRKQDDEEHVAARKPQSGEGIGGQVLVVTAPSGDDAAILRLLRAICQNGISSKTWR